MDHSYVGKRYSDQDIDNATGKFLVRIQTSAVRSENICRETAKLLAEQRVIGWFQGGSEFGTARARQSEPACGPAQARDEGYTQQSSSTGRPFRPFAPIVLAERQRKCSKARRIRRSSDRKEGPPRMAGQDSGDRPCRRNGAGSDVREETIRSCIAC